MKTSFREYFADNFFSDRPDELEEFLAALVRHRPKTFRVNRSKTGLDAFAKRWKERGLPMVPTAHPMIFSVGDERGVKLGNTPEHLGGHIYVQDLSAGMSVEVLCDGKVDPSRDLLILDMAASPGGKTTQLAEMYPNAAIVGNELDKTRLPQLLENIDRMGTDNIAVTNYSGAFFANFPETFDRILLDAPCSGEGIAHKAPESLEYWNPKNVAAIAKVQTRLLRAALVALKVGGTLVYSTCTLNKIENEGVVENAIGTDTAAFAIDSMHRYWPHREASGGFFITRIVKKSPVERGRPEKIPDATNRELVPATARSTRAVEEFFETAGAAMPDWQLWQHRDQILAFRDGTGAAAIADRWYALRFGKRVGRMEGERFIPDFLLLRDVASSLPRYVVASQEEYDLLRSGQPLPRHAGADGQEHLVAEYLGIPVGTLRDRGGETLENPIPRELKKAV